MLSSVLTPFASVQRISAREPVGKFATLGCRAGGTVHVRPATVIDVPVFALTVPRAALCWWIVGLGLQVRGVGSTAAPPLEPPSFPFVKPPELLKPADRFATRRVGGSCACPSARPAIVPPLKTVSNWACVS